MNIEAGFAIKERVHIPAIDIPGRIWEIKFNGCAVLYNVEYWLEGEIKSIWLAEDELAKERKKCTT